MKYKNVAELAIALKSSEEKVRNLLANNSIALQDVDDVLFDAMKSELAEVSIATPAKGFKPKEGSIAPSTPKEGSIATTQPKRSLAAISSVEEATRKQQEAAASLATAGAIAQTEFIEAVHQKADELQSEVFTDQKIEEAARLLVKKQQVAIDDVMGFLYRTTEGTAKQTIADIREASGVEVIEADVL